MEFTILRRAQLLPTSSNNSRRQTDSNHVAVDIALVPQRTMFPGCFLDLRKFYGGSIVALPSGMWASKIRKGSHRNYVGTLARFHMPTLQGRH